MVVWYILWLFGMFFLALVRCTKKNLATLILTSSENSVSFLDDIINQEFLSQRTAQIG
jgi:hypothetical protein